MEQEIRRYVIDAKSMIKNPFLLERNDIVLTSHTLRELSEIETVSQGTKISETVLLIKDMIRAFSVELRIDLKDYVWQINSDYSKKFIDNMLIQCCVENDYGIITDDLLLIFKAERYNIPVIKP
jgi:rRNA-processing protein FCF1